MGCCSKKKITIPAKNYCTEHNGFLPSRDLVEPENIWSDRGNSLPPTDGGTISTNRFDSSNGYSDRGQRSYVITEGNWEFDFVFHSDALGCAYVALADCQNDILVDRQDDHIDGGKTITLSWTVDKSDAPYAIQMAHTGCNENTFSYTVRKV